jgi:hypothetical protein
MIIAVIIGAALGIPLGIWCVTGKRPAPVHHAHRLIRYVGRYLVARSLWTLIRRH